MLQKKVPSSLSLSIILPCYNESECLELLIPKLLKILPPLYPKTTIIIVNDLGKKDEKIELLCEKLSLKLVNTPYNLGCQDALVYGIIWQTTHSRSDLVLTMDADGQDNPNDIPKLLSKVFFNSIVVGQRTSNRPEGIIFSIIYIIYKIIFRFFTNITPDFGNFAAYTQKTADYIAKSSHFKITYSYALPLIGNIVKIKSKRLPRIHGTSKVGYKGLFLHAIRSLLPYLSSIAIKIVSMSCLLFFLGVLIVTTLGFFQTSYSFSMFLLWQSLFILGLFILLIQAIILASLCFFTTSIYKHFFYAK